MKNVMLMGVKSRVGENLYRQLKNDYELSAYTNSHSDDSYDDVNFHTVDVFDLKSLRESLINIDTVIFFDDPILRSSKLTFGRFDDIFTLAADNFAQATAQSGVKKIIFVQDEVSPPHIQDVLGAYGTDVLVTQTKVKRYAKNINYKTSTYNSARSIMRSIIPENWTIQNVSYYYFAWLTQILGDIVQVESKLDVISIKLIKMDDPLIVLQLDNELSDHTRVLYNIIGGKIVVNEPKYRPRMEFRALKDRGEFIMAIHDYEPKIPWIIYLLFQAPLNGLVNKVYNAEMIINNNEEYKKISNHY